jgi:integrase/recombinase XerD
MLTDLYPRVSDRYRLLPILGPIVDGFAQGLEEQGYRRSSQRLMIRALRKIADRLQRRGYQRLPGLAREALRACAPADSQTDRVLAGTVHALERYLDRQGLLSAPSPEPPTAAAALLDAYAAFLRNVRGLAPSTVAGHLTTAQAFLEQLSDETTPVRLSALTAGDIEAFMCMRGPQVGRGTLQHIASQLRGFLRFLTSTESLPPGLEGTVDTPRLCRGEQLSRALPWHTVQDFLQAIDRSTPMGLRDHAMFSLIATYGLRASELVALTLDDIDWRAEQLHVPQRKTASALSLPLTEAVGDLLVEYLRQGRPQLTTRQLFLRMRAPAGALKPTAVLEAFEHWRVRSGLTIPFHGPHCLRHAYAVHLLRCGAPLKTIGDILGHRSAESTCVYLRLAIEDLREVPLDVPPQVDS